MKNQKCLSLLLALTMLFTCIPVGMFAEGEDTVAEETAPVVQETAPAVEETTAEEPAVEETQEETAPEAEEETPAAEETAEEASEEESAPTEEAEETVPVEEIEDEEPAAEESEEEENPSDEEPAEEVTEEEAVEDAFVAGLAKLTAGDVFADEHLKNKAGSVDQEAVVYATDRVTDDVIRIIANVDGEATALFVKGSRLTYLDADQTAAYQNDEHAEGIDYRGIKLDPIAFTAAVAEEPAAETVEETITEEPVVEETIAEEIVTETAAEDMPVVNTEAVPVEEETPEDDTESSDAPVYQTWHAIVALKTENSIPVRSTASTHSNEVVFRAVKGEQVTVLSEQGEWAQIRAAEGEGYIMLRFLEKVEIEANVAENEPVEASEDTTGVDEKNDDGDEIVEVESAEAGTGVVITKQPADADVIRGETAEFTVTATGDELTYQWQVKLPTSSSWGDTSFNGN
ncbi:MAG: SH3 domain-containing protein, partial [Clostridia bacterium]|nr:SH3 domain-containing protein [Clostridia bacterium]